MAGDNTSAMAQSWLPDGRPIAYVKALPPPSPNHSLTARPYMAQRRIWVADSSGATPVFAPILSKRLRHSGSFGPLKIFVDGTEANGATAGDLPQPRTHKKLQSKNFLDLAHGQSPGWRAIFPFVGKLPAIVLSRATGSLENSAQAERCSGTSLKRFGFIGVHLIPESCSRSPRNSVRNHPGIALTFPRIPQRRRSRRNLGGTAPSRDGSQSVISMPSRRGDVLEKSWRAAENEDPRLSHTSRARGRGRWSRYARIETRESARTSTSTTSRKGFPARTVCAANYHGEPNSLRL
jgi:hypothetical protein